MFWNEVEKAFSRSIALSFSKQRMMLTFPVLVLCGLLTVFCRAAACHAGDWVSFSLAFLPILLSSGILLALGVLLVRIHFHEIKQLSVSFSRLITGSLDLIVGTSYLSVPPVLAYLLLWVVLGVFFLLKEIPGIGSFFSVVFAFGPFLLIFGSLLLCLFTLGLLFYVAPAAALQSVKRMSLAKQVFTCIKGRLLTSLALFFIALVPILLVVGLLSLSAILTNLSFTMSDRSLMVAMEWFFIMLPFSAILTPATIFFFNFAAESHQILMKK
jgi:hypothetical protein